MTDILKIENDHLRKVITEQAEVNTLLHKQLQMAKEKLRECRSVFGLIAAEAEKTSSLSGMVERSCAAEFYSGIAKEGLEEIEWVLRKIT